MDGYFQHTGSMAMQDPQGYTAVRIPHPQGAVNASRDQQGSLAFAASGVCVGTRVPRDKAHTNSLILMPVEYLERLTRLHLPEYQAFVLATGCDAFFVGTKGDPLYIVIMPLQDLQCFPCFHIPHPGSIIIGATGQEFSRGAEGKPTVFGNLFAMPFQAAYQLASLCLPQADDPLIVSAIQ